MPCERHRHACEVAGALACTIAKDYPVDPVFVQCCLYDLNFEELTVRKWLDAQAPTGRYVTPGYAKETLMPRRYPAEPTSPPRRLPVAMREGAIIEETRSVHLTAQQLDDIFFARLKQLTDGCYFAKVYRHHPEDGITRPTVLCRESEPHPHNGDTWDEEVRDLSTQQRQRVLAAMRLYELLMRETEPRP